MKKGKRFWFYLLIIGVLFLFTNSCKKVVDNTNITDRDGNVYNTVTIGTQTWLEGNLKTTKYQNGDLIGTTTPATLDITGESFPKYQWPYDGSEGNSDTYGRLYTWYAATDSRNVCPTGYHLPTDAEWTTLTAYLGGEDVSGGKLKETGLTHWLTPNTSATNETGFTALPDGYRLNDGTFLSIGNYGYFWSSTENSTISAWNRTMSYGSASVSRDGSYKQNGFTVRCLKD